MRLQTSDNATFSIVRGTSTLDTKIYKVCPVFRQKYQLSNAIMRPFLFASMLAVAHAWVSWDSFY